MKSSVLPIFGLALSLSCLSANATPHSQTIVNQIMPSAQVDLARDFATLPLRLGHLKDGRNVWFIITDTSDAKEATRLGVVHSAQTSAVLDLKSTRTATVDSDGNFTFNKGTVDFSPKRALVPGDAPNFFPPKSFSPGAVGDADYSPFVRLEGTNIVYNAPIVAFDVDASKLSFCEGGVDYDLVLDRVTRICASTMQVSLQLGHGFASGDQVIYLSTDSNNALPATMEAAVYAPATSDILGSGASESLFALANGATGVSNPDRQGFNSALSGEGPPLNILDGLTINSHGYTPMWDVNVAVWTSDAITKGNRHLLTGGSDVAHAAQAGFLTNPMGGTVQSLELLVNCPVIGFLK